MRKAIRLWERDYRILQDLKYGFCTTNQIAKLYFSSNSRKAGGRLKLLFEHRFVARFTKPLLDVRGKPEYVYCKRGRVVRGYVKVNHCLAVSDFRVSFLLWRQFSKKFWGEFFYYSQLPSILSGDAVRPDAVCTVERKGKKLLYLLEVDLGSESLVASGGYGFADKLDVYADYFDSGQFRDDFKWMGYSFKCFRVLIVFDSEKRLSNFMKIASEKNADFVLASAFGRLKQKGFAGKVWVGIDRRSLSLVGG